MFGKDAYNTVKLLIRKYVKAAHEDRNYTNENSRNYTALLWSYNYLMFILGESEEFAYHSTVRSENKTNNVNVTDASFEPANLFDDSPRTPYWEIIRDLDLNILKGYLDYWNLIEELLIAGKTSVQDLDRHFQALKILLNEVLASDCFTERYKGRIEERYICLWDKRLVFEAKQNLAAFSARYPQN